MSEKLGMFRTWFLKEESKLQDKNVRRKKMKNTGISQYAIGDAVEGFMLIKEARKGTASNGKAPLTLSFTDSTGEIDAKLSDASPEDGDTSANGVVVKIKGDINEF